MAKAKSPKQPKDEVPEQAQAGADPVPGSEGPDNAPDAPPAPARKHFRKALVNMTMHDGTHLIAGQPGHLSHPDHERLRQDARGPFFEE